MRGLTVTEQRPGEKRLAGTFFFSRKYTDRCTTGYFFATLAYQLASNFPSVRDDLTAAIRENPALLDPKKSLRDQMEALFLRPLRRLQLRLQGCLPLVFVVDALDECTSGTDIVDLISLLGRALREHDLPVTHVLLTSRLEPHIHEAIDEEDVRPLVHEIPVRTSGEGVTSLISLDGADVDSDIYTFLEHSFTRLRSRYPTFPQPSKHDLARLASRAGRRFIVAFTMMNFIDDGRSDPRDQLMLMLELTSKLLPGTEVFKFYDNILLTCADPERAYLHLSVVAALANPLPMSQISELLGPREGRDVERVLVQLRSVMDIPTDSNLPVNIYHSSVRDYVLEPSNCGLFEEPYIIPHPHALLAYSSLRLMIQDIPENTGLLDAILKLKSQNHAMESHPPQSLRDSLGFAVEPPTAQGVVITLLWLRGYRSPVLYSWLETRDGHAWLRTQEGKDWLETQGVVDWLQTQTGSDWLRTQDGKDWLQTPGMQIWLESLHGLAWLLTQDGRNWLPTRRGWEWLRTWTGEQWLQSQSGQAWLLSLGGPWLTARGREWLQTPSGQEWLIPNRRNLIQNPNPSMADWLQTLNGRGWLRAQGGQGWLQTQSGLEWLQTPDGREWLRSQGGGREWLQTQGGREWLQTPHGQAWQSTPAASFLVHMEEFLHTVEAINKFIIAPELSSCPALQTIQQFKSLPDFLMFPASLALTPQAISALIPGLDFEIVHAIDAFVDFANEAQKRSRASSNALIYACQNWSMHLSQAPNPRDDMLGHVFEVFWDHHLLSWLERLWCLRGLRACLVIISEAQKFAMVCIFVFIFIIHCLTCSLQKPSRS